MGTKVDCFTSGSDVDENSVIEITPLCAAALAAWREARPAHEGAWVAATGFEGRLGELCLVPNEHGELAHVLIGGDAEKSPMLLGELAQKLPAGNYQLSESVDEQYRGDLLFGAAAGAYRFERYVKRDSKAVRFVLPDNELGARVRAQASATYLARDLINTPAADMMPEDLALVAADLAGEFDATITEYCGDELLVNNFPSIHAVGRASAHPPRLIQMQWGREDAPCIALIGKGVCFDSGGLDIKPATGMRWMKKDMGGAAHVLALARLIMETKLDVRLLMLIPAVENAISGNAMRPGDILNTRKGSTVEVDNTDAEGRLVLSDALTLASEFKPKLIIDFATLTGAARVAVGTDIAAMFCNNDKMAAELEKSSRRTHDPIWRLPLHQAYRTMICSRIADIVNSGGTPYGGAITAALFLEHFVNKGTAWAHFDIMAFNRSPRPGHPEGGEAMGVRAVFNFLEGRYR